MNRLVTPRSAPGSSGPTPTPDFGQRLSVIHWPQSPPLPNLLVVKAFVVSDQGGRLSREVLDYEPHQVNDDDLLVEVHYSSVNFKDALVASSPSRVRRVDTVVGGVDAAGVVVKGDALVPRGTSVAVHGGDIGVNRDGGFAEFLYAPRRCLSPLPSAISTRDAMIIGTAGFTAMASVLALEDRGLVRGANVLVTGATGGVGSQSVAYLARMGYRPTAATGSPREREWLVDLGAAQVIDRDAIDDRPQRVLATEQWDGAVDCVGGETLHRVLRSLRYGAAVAASGLVAGSGLDTTLYPFITRAVSLVGIDAVAAPSKTRRRVWDSIAALAPLIDFERFVDHLTTLDGISNALDEVARGATRGRTLVALRDS